MRNPDYKLGYSRGYNAGRGPNWPAHKPPSPPNDLVAKLMETARRLRDGVDDTLATLDEDDAWSIRLGPMIDDLDEAFIAIGDWIKSEQG